VTRPEPQVIVVFGARGDLARRKLLPGLLRLERAGLLPADYRVIGSGRHEPDGPWPEEVRSRLAEDGADVGDGAWERLGARLAFVASSADDGEALAAAVREARAELGGGAGVVLYMSVPPSAMQPMVRMLGATGLAEGARVVMEKPFGRDLASARELNDALHEHFHEEQIFRIDHFLGKEAVQGILALRLANGVFEPVWNNRHIASVQIDVPEAIGLEGRAGFYEETGAFRDMVVTHLAQVLGFLAMDRPPALDAAALQDAKAAVFADLRRFGPADAVYGQYEGFREEEGIDPDSRTETFVALRAEIDDDRWRGVPFLLRTGKAMAEGRRVVTVTFRDPGEVLVPPAQDGDRAPDVLVMELSEDPRIALELRVKRPGPELVAARARMELDVEEALHAEGLEAYEKLLLDVMRGDHLLFTRADEIEMLWERSADLLEHPPEPVTYPKGGWGPEAAVDLAGPAGWRLPEDGAAG
jgi:glucose-6-phosphate 1-dehydrogenase